MRDGAFKTVTRAATLERSTDVTDELWRAARELFDTWAARSFRPVRLIGMQAKGLTHGPDEPSLFENPKQDRLRLLDRATDKIQSKFGDKSIARARTGKRQTRL